MTRAFPALLLFVACGTEASLGESTYDAQCDMLCSSADAQNCGANSTQDCQTQCHVRTDGIEEKCARCIFENTKPLGTYGCDWPDDGGCECRPLAWESQTGGICTISCEGFFSI